jgi:hypothetical protein
MLAFTERARSYENGDMVYDPLHYLPLIERKIMAFDQAAPLQNRELPDAFVTLQRLLERFGMDELHGAVKDALRMGAISFDAVKHLALCRVEHRPPRLDLDTYPFLPRMNVETTSASAYMSLLTGAAS